MKQRPAWKAVVPIGIAALVLTGCAGGGGTASPDPSGSDDATATDATLRINFGYHPENWSPGQEMEGGPLRIVYETLLAPGDDGRPAPLLATEYELTPEAMTLELREGVTFHDGEPFDAEAVAANVELVQGAATAYSGALSTIESVEVLDEHSVRFNLSAPTPSLPALLTSRTLPIGSPAAIEDGSIAQHPVGTAPWAYDEAASVMGTRLTFDRFDGYWGDQPAFSTIELFNIVEEEARAAALQAGEIDLSDMDMVTAETLGEGFEHLAYPAIRNNVTFFDRGPGGMFESQELRQAVCYAIDVPQWAEIDGEGAIDATQHFTEGESGYSDEIEGYPFDLGRAQELYAAAGSPSIQAEMVAAPYNSRQIEVYATQLAELGDVSITVTQVPPPQFNSEWNTGRYPLGLGAHDQASPFEWYSTYFAADAPANPSGVESSELAAAAEAAIAAGDSEEAAELWGDAMRIISEEALSCAHLQGTEVLAWSADAVAGVEAPAELWEAKLVNFRDITPAGQ